MKAKLAAAWGWAKQVYGEFTQEHASLTAGAIALFGLLSLFPLVLLAISVAAYALGNPATAAAQIEGVVSRFLVGQAGSTLTGTITGVVRTRGAAGIIGLLGFLWAASRIFAIIMQAFNMAWDVDESRSFIKRNLLAIGFVLVAFVFGVIAFAAPLAVGFVLHYSDLLTRTVGVSVNTARILSLLTNLIAYAATVGLFYLLYKVLPNRRVHWKTALVGALFAGTLWEIVKYLFQLYLVNFSAYNKVYGALAGVIVLILWLYYSAMILLLGTVTASVYSRRVYGDHQEHPEREAWEHRRAA